MNAAAIVATLHARGARLEVLPDERIAVTPKAALDDALRAAIRAHKAALVEELRRAAHVHVDDRQPHENIADELPATTGWRVVVESCEPFSGPIRVNPWTTITAPTKCIEASLADLELACAVKSAGYERSAVLDVIDERLAVLAACGCHVHIEAVQ